jgi:AmmeMemoRadiSam system protein B
VCSQRIFILGPSHHHYTKICELSRHALYSTPLAPLQLDRDVISTLKSTKAFGDMSTQVDEEEHSIEMQLPFLAHVMKRRSKTTTKPAAFTLVPILVGSLSTKAEAEFARILQPYFADPANFFVISSDFCQSDTHTLTRTRSHPLS